MQEKLNMFLFEIEVLGKLFLQGLFMYCHSYGGAILIKPNLSQWPMKNNKMRSN